ncbi:MAG: nucleotidyltransferase family protein [Oscillospiraceae bacterium]|nr:nucleotidyltransferase family protein [Oscillospiraceae bacterium]
MVTGVICEYNPFHLGHKKQLDVIRKDDPDGTIVCIMSGNFVQRGAPAIIDKTHRAKAAILSGADLVLELPITSALSSAEDFAAGGVSALNGFCDRLCFGAETADVTLLQKTADCLLSEEYRTALRLHLDKGLSFPAARQEALTEIGINTDFISKPNNILAVEYCKAILSQNSSMTPYPITRHGNYHSTDADTENPSATFIRQQMANNAPWECFIPQEAAECFKDAKRHYTHNGERAILYKLRTMSDAEFEALPYGSEGLWRKLMHAARSCATLDEIIAETKSKRYTRTRLDRMIMCAYLGITKAQLESNAPYIRVLAFNQKGRKALKSAREYGNYFNIGQRIDSWYQDIEDNSGSLYGLFAEEAPENANIEQKKRIYSY